jgi:hypothetical protein
VLDGHDSPCTITGVPTPTGPRDQDGAAHVVTSGASDTASSTPAVDRYRHVLDETVARLDGQLVAEPALSEALTATVATATGHVLVRVVPAPSAAANVVEWIEPHGVRLPELLDVADHGELCAETWEYLDAVTGDRLPAGAVGTAIARFERSGLAQHRAPRRPAPLLTHPLAGVAVSPAKYLLGSPRVDALCALVERAWSAWVRDARPLGWTHGDLCATNTGLVDDQSVVWDLSGARWGPLGCDVADMLATGRRRGVTDSDVRCELDAYRDAGGLVDIDAAAELEAAVAATMVVHDAALPAAQHPAGIDEIRLRARSILDDSGERWCALRVRVAEHEADRQQR